MMRVILVGLVALALAACTTTQHRVVEKTTNVLCSNVALVQMVYNVAMMRGDHDRVNQLFDSLRLTCPVVLTLIQEYRPAMVVPPAPPPPGPTPERG